MFVPGRLIKDNVIAAFELLHTMSKRSKGSKGFMALKLDISQVEWKFECKVMERMGFPNH